MSKRKFFITCERGEDYPAAIEMIRKNYCKCSEDVFSEKIAKSIKSIKAWEAGKMVASDSTIMDICKAFNLTFEYRDDLILIVEK